jgi:hypothetical protein
MFCLLYSPKQKIVKLHAEKQIGKSHMIDIFTSEDMENISLYLQYLTLWYFSISLSTWYISTDISDTSVSHSLLDISVLIYLILQYLTQ